LGVLNPSSPAHLRIHGLHVHSFNNVIRILRPVNGPFSSATDRQAASGMSR
jgi:hypothetical protein